MVVAQLKLVVVASWLMLGTALLAGACTGAQFEGGATGGAGGGGNGPACTSLADCDDRDPCTSDVCTIEGKCQVAPKCSGNERCCAGECAGCCDDSQCDDGIACTTNTCFAGQCMYIPDDGKCGPAQFCSVTESCKAKVACGPSLPDVTCEDFSNCTTDSCESGFCKNQFCADGSLCCDTGCAAECCTDAGCDKDRDPCTVGSCQDGRCSSATLCGDGDKCCPSADGTSASCGACCSAAECDDGVPCTDDSCTGAPLGCSHNPNDKLCNLDAGELCDPAKGCQKPVQCSSADECRAGNCGRCEDGSCKYDCPDGQPCCPETNTCAACCESSCNDGVDCTVDACGPNGCTHTPDPNKCLVNEQCDVNMGCVRCLKDIHCDDGNACTTDTCDQNTNTCLHASTCECKTGFDCQAVIQTKAAFPPIGTGCPVCVDGKCQLIDCSGSCCSSGCYKGLCPD